MQRIVQTKSFFESVVQFRCQADMLCVRGSTGRDTYALLQKQFSHLGLPHWNRIPTVAAESVKVIHMYMFLSDGGPDQR